MISEEQIFEFTAEVLEWAYEACEEVSELSLVSSIENFILGGPAIAFILNNGQFDGLFIWFTETDTPDSDQSDAMQFYEEMHGNKFQLLYVYGKLIHAINAIKQYLAALNISSSVH